MTRLERYLWLLNHNKKKIAAYFVGTLLCALLFAATLIQKGISSATAVGEVQITSGYLNVRKGPSTSYAYLKSGSAKVTLSDGKQLTIIAKNGKWYHVKFKLAGKTYTGYIHSAYVKVLTGSVKTSIAAKTSKTSVSLYKKAANNAALVKVNGKEFKLAKKAAVKIISEKIVGQQKWYYVSTKSGSKKIKGYVQAKYIKVTYKKGMPGKVYANGVKQVLYKKAGAKVTVKVSGKELALSNNAQVKVLAEKKSKGVKYYKVSVRTGKETVKGFLPEYAMKFQIVGREEPGSVPTQPPAKKTAKPKATATKKPNKNNTGNAALTDAQFRKKMKKLGFPSDYITKLAALHKEYPNWDFEPFKTQVDWSAAVAAESKVGLNLLSNGKSPDWKSTAAGAYNWAKDQYVVYDGTTWVTASTKAVSYYMDPRNFLDDRGIFQFESLEYQKNIQTQTGVENILKNTPMYNSSFSYKKSNGKAGTMKYSKAFIKAAAASGVSPYHLASRSKQEVVTGPSSMSNSVSGKVSGHVGIYNFYNIGANNSAGGGAVAKGLAWASTGTTYQRPWTDPYKSIVGGGEYIGSQYINVGQNTLYLQKFNVTAKNRYNHQYMANIEAPNSEATKTKLAYGDNIKNTAILFSIPVYNNMPASACPIPSGGANPNNYLQTLSVSGYSFSTPFAVGDDGSKTYSLTVANNVSTVTLNASAINASATVTGAGTKNLAVGNNNFNIQVKAANGSVRTYKVQITRKSNAAAKKAKKTQKQDANKAEGKNQDSKTDQAVSVPAKTNSPSEPQETQSVEE